MMETVGGKEELLLTLDVRAVGGIYPTVLGVVPVSYTHLLLFLRICSRINTRASG